MANLGTKLKALLAAGLIGTAGLGMQSCSNPSDSVYYPYTVEAPSTDNPGSGGAETSNPSGGEENGGDGGETVNENEVTFSDLGVNETDADRIKNAASVMIRNGCSIKMLQKDAAKFGKEHVYFYIKGENPSFKDVLDRPESDIPMELIKYYSTDGDKYYYIPADMLEDFTKAGAKALLNQ